jgi:hypothetical protein
VTQQATTKENGNKLIEFRQAVYENGILKRRDALFDLLDALICERSVASFARLSQSERFMRKWPSLYAAVEDGKLDSRWLRTYLAGQVPHTEINVFPLDGSPWPRPRSRVLDDRQYVSQASSDVTLREDPARLSVGSAGQVMAILNNLVIHLALTRGKGNLTNTQRCFDAKFA